jgi:hypothetical protein
MIIPLQIPTEVITPILNSGPNNVTGWGIALTLSIALNYFIYKEFKFLQGKFLAHLDKLSLTLDEIHEKLNNK